MFSESAALYDLVYSSFKDYGAEAAQVADLIAREHPSAHTVLDVGCGTGEHARLLSERFGYRVDGFDLEPEFARIAQQKNPDGHFWQADMRSFDAGRRYDVVLCLFSSIGYVRTQDAVTQTLGHFRSHLAADGLVLVEPWFTPGAFSPGRLHVVTVETDAVTVCRMGHSWVEDAISHLTFEYLVGSADGIRHVREIHELGLFTREQMCSCFDEAGLEARYEGDGPSGRGLYVARLPE